MNTAFAHGGHSLVTNNITHLAIHVFIAGVLLLPSLLLAYQLKAYRLKKNKQAQVAPLTKKS
jgi:hypothetical protein